MLWKGLIDSVVQHSHWSLENENSWAQRQIAGTLASSQHNATSSGKLWIYAWIFWYVFPGKILKWVDDAVRVPGLGDASVKAAFMTSG